MVRCPLHLACNTEFGNSDTAAKQILLHLDANASGATKFVLRDSTWYIQMSYVLLAEGVLTLLVDDTHLLIKSESLEWAQETLQVEVRLRVPEIHFTLLTPRY
jgi:hypothetical protein